MLCMYTAGGYYRNTNGVFTIVQESSIGGSVVEACSQPALCGSATALNSIYHYGVMIHTNNYTYTGSVSICNYPVGGRSMTVVRRERR